MTTTIGSGERKFTWDSNWAKLPDHIRTGNCHGAAESRDGHIYIFNQSAHPVLKFTPDGAFVSSWGKWDGAHGMTYHVEGSDEFFWLTDEHSTAVQKTTLDGQVVMSIEKSPHHTEGKKYAPTWAAQAPDGTIYVTDGYGSSSIYTYDAAGQPIGVLDGTAGLGKFNCPHAIWIGVREQATCSDQPVLYVADRGNRRVQVFSLPDMKFIKGFAQWHPCSFSVDPTSGDLLVPDLHAFINIYDAADNPVAQHLGDNREHIGYTWDGKRPGWPNLPEAEVVDGKFNSPHGCTYDRHGNIYIAEWIPRGRITKLTRVR